MSALSFWQQVDITSSHTPVTQKDEFIYLVQDSIGLYQGKAKILGRQNGRVYLTSSRLIYVDNILPEDNSLSISLFDIDHLEFYSGFLKSSPKITIWFKDHTRNVSAPSSKTNLSSYNHSNLYSSFKNKIEFLPNQLKESDETIWVCSICYFANHINNSSFNFDKILVNDFDFKKLPNCQNCGIKSKKNTIVNAIKKFKAKNNKNGNLLPKNKLSTPKQPTGTELKEIKCPRCTFLNYPLMLNCEICGEKLKSSNISSNTVKNYNFRYSNINKPSKIKIKTEFDDGLSSLLQKYIKLSFRNLLKYDDFKNFLNKLQVLIDEQNLSKLMESADLNHDVKSVLKFDLKDYKETSRSQPNLGILGLEKKQTERAEYNVNILNTSMSDLDSLMKKAKDLMVLADKFNDYLNKYKNTDDKVVSNATDSIIQSRQLLGLNPNTETNNISDFIMTNNFNFLNKLNNKELYYNELARNISSFLNNHIFKSDNSYNFNQFEENIYSGGILTLSDLYALYNRSLGFNNNLISPEDLLEACKRFSSLQLPLILKEFSKTNLLVIQDSKMTDDIILQNILLWMETDYQLSFSNNDYLKSFDQINVLSELYINIINTENDFKCGCNIQMLSSHFKLSIGVLEEILEIAVNDGKLIIDKTISGVVYYLNEFNNYEYNVKA
ncbi:ESCRT-II subunit protein VPS36 ASCRUDRAFT_68998 [Ascoidea rubescens DSM 1968]|uniref:Vacuolar protein-sorting-associated protein 36 n=1 Tax=Ascoidea rubescens DSM 1968 TaxID=1344418 RepID=A0A1D2VKU9_9ASCO|nr:hypothetical protein ASCRUDRAFT_68998 [Ascoidea rubescens DSM 1968]ODV62167.1 hypothetical protein ASCRUDRAFT_68998 [Ascoidea rubescens DSM 1968]